MADLYLYIKVPSGVLCGPNGQELQQEDERINIFSTTVPTMRVSLLNDDSTVYTGLNVGDAIRVSIAALVSGSVTVMQRVLAAPTIEPTLGYFEFPMDTNTTEWNAVVTAATDPQSAAKLEVQITPSGETEVKKVWRVPLLCSPVYDDQVTTPTDIPVDYPSWSIIQAWGVGKALFIANSILVANTTATPIAMAIPEQTMVGRITGGSIAALTATQIKTLLGVSASADTVLKALFNANTILTADADDDPAPLTIAEQTLVGRITGGNIVGLTVTQIKALLDYRFSDFAEETAWRLFYSNTDGDMTALVLGTKGAALQSAGAAAAPVFGYASDIVFAPAGTGLTEGLVYYNASGTWTVADPSTLVCQTCELFLALGTSAAADGMLAMGRHTKTGWTWSVAPLKPLYMGDAGAITETVPTLVTHASKVGRIVGFGRAATGVRFAPETGVLFDGGGS